MADLRPEPAQVVRIEASDLRAMLAENAHLRAQVTSLQAHNTEALERARRAEAECDALRARCEAEERAVMAMAPRGEL